MIDITKVWLVGWGNVDETDTIWVIDVLVRDAPYNHAVCAASTYAAAWALFEEFKTRKGNAEYYYLDQAAANQIRWAG